MFNHWIHLYGIESTLSCIWQNMLRKRLGTSIEQYSTRIDPLVHNVFAEHDINISSSHLPKHDPYPSIPWTNAQKSWHTFSNLYLQLIRGQAVTQGDIGITPSLLKETQKMFAERIKRNLGCYNNNIILFSTQACVN